MPRRATHAQVGGLVGASAALLLADQAGQPADHLCLETLGGLLGGSAGGLVPDLLEPAIGWNHRRTGHSLATGASITTLTATQVRNLQAQLRAHADAIATLGRQEPPPARAALLALREAGIRLLAGAVPGIATGYLSHLVLDSQTWQGLPLA